MIPDTYDNAAFDFEVTELPGLTYAISGDHIIGMCDGIQALEQAVYKILSTERYESMIYSWMFGVELEELKGNNMDFVEAELEERIHEALIQDDRIEDVIDFQLKRIGRNRLEAVFTVISTLGELEIRKEVEV